MRRERSSSDRVFMLVQLGAVLCLFMPSCKSGNAPSPPNPQLFIADYIYDDVDAGVRCYAVTHAYGASLSCVKVH